MSRIEEQLRTYTDSDFLPMHMPGHKRRMGDLGNPFFIDITEIDGFDDLHHADGILLDAQKRAAELYGSEETHYLVNGSTSGILAAVSGCVDPGETLIMARNSHKSVYHAALLGNLKTVYIYPQIAAEMGINDAISPEDVEKTLQEHPEAKAVLITSPTYEGVVSDVKSIAKIVHQRQIPLIVDEAHGAHFPFCDQFPEDSVRCGADVVIHSVHKTLPSLTQTALIHLNGTLTDREKIRFFLSVYQTSSPSYVLMAGIDQCMEWVRTHKSEFSLFWERLQKCRRELKKMKTLRLLEEEHMDDSKILISTAASNISGQELAQMLREQYRIEVEMACGSYICAITTAADQEKDLNRFADALLDLDQKIPSKECFAPLDRERDLLLRAEWVMTAAEAWKQEKLNVNLKEAVGKVSGAFVIPYPPGIPLLVPGERIDQKIIDRIQKDCGDGRTVYGTDGIQLNVLKER